MTLTSQWGLKDAAEARCKGFWEFHQALEGICASSLSHVFIALISEHVCERGVEPSNCRGICGPYQDCSPSPTLSLPTKLKAVHEIISYWEGLLGLCSD